MIYLLLNPILARRNGNRIEALHYRDVFSFWNGWGIVSFRLVDRWCVRTDTGFLRGDYPGQLSAFLAAWRSPC